MSARPEGDELAEEGQIELRAGSSRATIAPALGGRLAQVDLGAGPLLRGHEPGLDWAAWGSYPLLPWSNRIPGGRLTVAGRDIQLPVTWPDGSAIHGLAATVAWEVVEVSGRAVSLGLEIELDPWRLDATQRVELSPGRLRQEVAVRNVGPEAVPVGLGIHPWFRAGALRVPADQVWPGEPLPIGPPVPVAGAHDLRAPTEPAPMDSCFTGLTVTHVEVPGARLSWSGPITQVVVYSGEPGWLAVEPVTMANDGFGLAERGIEGHGVISLPPGEELSVAFELTPPSS